MGQMVVVENHARNNLRWNVEEYLESVVRATREFGLRDQAERIRTLMRAFYAYILFLAFPWASAASTAWTSHVRPKPKVHVAVAELIPLQVWDSARVLGCIVLILGAVLLCVQPRLRWPRILVAIAFVLTTAIQFDLKGKVDHGNHLAMWMAIALCFLCKDQSPMASQRRFVASFLGVQILLCTLYSSAGICKLIGTFYDAQGGLTWFHREALPYMITGNWDRSKTTLLGGFLVLHPGLSALCQASAFVLELGALPAVFFRHLHRPWALALITLHVMILHSMKIHFHQSCFVLVLTLVASPFAPSFRSTIGLVRATMRNRKEAGELEPTGARSAEMDRTRAARWARFWGPGLAVVYLLLAFARFQPSRGAFLPEIYPVSPMAMFFRLHPSPAGMEKVKALRARLEREGLFPERNRRLGSKKSALRKSRRH